MADPPQQDTERVKWGWNGETGEVVIWTVRGAGDGRPTHDEHLEQMWGRPPSPEDGDVMGLARWVVLEGADHVDELVVEAYYDSDVPAAVIEDMTANFPGLTISTAT